MFSNIKNSYQLVFTICLFIVLSAFITIGVTIYSIHKTAYEGAKELVLAQTKNIDDSLVMLLNESALAARMVSISPVFIELLENESKLSQEEMQEVLKKHLKKFSQNFGYSTISIVSEKSKKYYTDRGYIKTLNTWANPHDLWYKLFLDLDKSYDFSMGFDSANDGKWTLFTNVRINNEKGELLGVSGFGRDLAYLRDLLKGLENEHGLKIYFINENGDVMLGSNTNRVKERLLANEKRNENGSFEFSDISNNFVVTKYIKEIGWTLTVEKKKELSKIIFDIIWINLFATLIILAVIITLSAVLIHKKHKHLISLSQKDGLSGLLNRISGEEQIAILLEKGKKGVFYLLDIDKFKAINDTYGHSAGDEVIKKIASSLSKIAREGDVVFRLGGDEFGLFALGLAGDDNAFKLINRLFDEINKEPLSAIKNKEIELSAGASFVLNNDDFTSIYARVDRALYESKKTSGSILNIF